MKKLISLSLVMAIMLSMVACGGKSNNHAAANGAGGTGNGTVSNDKNQNAGQPGQDPETEEDPEQEPDENVDKSDTTEPSGEGSEDSGEQTGEQTGEEAPTVTASHTDVTFKAAGSSFSLQPQGIEGIYAATYSSADETIATVTENGTVTAVSPGTTTISMHVEGNGAQYDFTCIVRCNWTETTDDEGGENDSPVNSVDLSAFFSSFMEGLGESAPFMMDMTGEIADNFYPGLSSYAVKQSVIQGAAISSVPFEFTLLELENADDVEAVKAILQGRVDAQVAGGAWYPETIEAWEQAEIVVNGNFVALIVAGEQQSEAVAAYKALFE